MILIVYRLLQSVTNYVNNCTTEQLQNEAARLGVVIAADATTKKLRETVIEASRKEVLCDLYADYA